MKPINRFTTILAGAPVPKSSVGVPLLAVPRSLNVPPIALEPGKPRSNASVLALNVTLEFNVSVPTPTVPGDRVAPLLRLTAPASVPVPASVPALLTVTAPLHVPTTENTLELLTATALAAAVEPVKDNVPALTAVAPE